MNSKVEKCNSKLSVIELPNVYIVSKIITSSQDIRDKGFELIREVAKLLNDRLISYEDLIDVAKLIEFPLYRIENSFRYRVINRDEEVVRDENELIKEQEKVIDNDSEIIKDEYLGEKKIKKVLSFDEEWI